MAPARLCGMCLSAGRRCRPPQLPGSSRSFRMPSCTTSTAPLRQLWTLQVQPCCLVPLLHAPICLCGWFACHSLSWLAMGGHRLHSW